MADSYELDEEAPETQAKQRRPPVRFDPVQAQENFIGRQAERQANLERYRIELSNDEYERLDAIYPTLFPDEQSEEEHRNNEYRLATSMKLSRMYNIPVESAYKNLDAILETTFTRELPPVTAWRAVSDAYAIAQNNEKLNAMGMELRTLAKGSEERNALWKEVQTLRQENLALKDPFRRNFFFEGAKGVAESSVFSLKGSVAGGIGSMIHPVVGVIAGAATAALSTVGLEYLDLLESGVDDDIAWRTAMVSSGIQGVFEGLSADIPVFRNSGFGQQIFKMLHNGGNFGAFAKAVGAGAINIFTEGITEVAQEKTGQTAADMARDSTEEKVRKIVASGEGADEDAALEKAASDLATAAYGAYLKLAEMYPEAALPGDTPEEKKAALLESFRVAVLSSFLTGIPVAIRDTAVNVRELKQIQAAARIAPDFETSDEILKKAENRTYAGLDEETRREIYGRNHEEYRQSVAAEEVQLRKTRLYDGTDTSGDPVYHDAEGNLYAENIRHTDSGGVTTGEYAGGDPGKMENNLYWKLKYRMEGDQAIVEGLRIGENYEGLKPEILQGFANDTGQEVVWEGETYRPAEGATGAVHIGFDKGIPKTPENAAQGPSRTSGGVFEALTGKEKEFFDKIRALPEIRSDIEARAAVEAVRLNAALNMQTLEEHLGRDFEAGMIGAPDAEVQAAAQTQGGRKKGAVRFDPETGKAMISVFRGADASTVIHEGAHVLRRKLAGDYLAEAERVFGVKDGKWTEPNEEAFAGAYEKYLETGKAPTSKLAELFAKFKEFMGRIYQLVKNNYTLTPDRAAFFDRIFRDARANLEAMEGRDAAREPAGTEGGTAETPYAEQLNRKIDGLNRQGREKAREMIRERGETPLWQPDMSGDDAVINDPDAGYAEKAGAVAGKAGKAYAAARLDPADRKHGPTAALISRAMRIADPAERALVTGEIRALRDQYAGTDAEFKAPNGKPSLLIEALGEEKGREAWYAVRTPSFKNWFGDWERAARIAEVEGISAKVYTVLPAIGKKEAKDIFRNFEPVTKKFAADFFSPTKYSTFERQNIHDNGEISLSVKFPVGTVGKLRGFLNNNAENIISETREIFDKSVYAFSSNYTLTDKRADGSSHKSHDNVEAYHHFINKVAVGKETYYVRFVVEELKNAKGQLHSAQISQVEILGKKNKPVENRLPSGKTPGEIDFTSSDTSLVEYFDSVKGKVSQVVDANGEPKPVFHQTDQVFDIFETRREGAGTSDHETPYGIFLKDSARDIGVEGQIQMPLFANIKNPLRVENRQELVRLLNGMPEYAELGRQLRENDRKYQELLDAAEAEDDAAYKKWWEENHEKPEAHYHRASDTIDGTLQDWQEANRSVESRMKELVNQYLAGKGYDGIDLKADEGSYGRRVHTTIALDSTRIKSATDNAGTYGGENPSILFQDDADTQDVAQTVQHEGEYVLTREGNRDFGEIPHITAEGRDISGGPVRLRIGKQEGTEGNYGEKHIERPDRLKQIQQNGYQNARDLVEDVAQNYNAIYPGKFAPLTLVKYNGKKDSVICVELTPSDEVDFYDVKTAFIAKHGYVKNKTPLWVNPNNGAISEPGKTPTNQRIVTSPREFTGNSDTLNVSQTGEKSSPDTFFQDEDDLAAFMRNDPAVVRQAMTFDTPEGFQDYYEAMEAAKQPGDLLETAARKAFYTTIWEEGQKLKRQEAALAGASPESAGTGQKTVDDFLDLVDSGAGLMDIVRVTKGIQDEMSTFQREGEAAEQRHNAEMRAFKNAFSHQNWKNARIQLAQNKPIAPSTARFIRNMVKRNPLPYMEAWAVISGDDSWLPAETRSRLVEGEDFEYETDKSPEELRRIQQAIDHDGIVREIRDKTLKADDPRLDNYDEEQKRLRKEYQKKIVKAEEALSAYPLQIEQAKINLEKQEQLAVQIAAQQAADTTPEGITAARRQQHKVQEAQNQLLRLRKEYASFLDSVKLADKANFKEFMTLLRILARTENALKAVEDLRRIRKNEMKTVLRHPDYKTVYYEQAHQLEWVQSFFDHLPEVLPKFIGPKAKNLRELFSDFTTKEEYRDTLKKTLRPHNYSQVEHIVYEDTAARKVRDYSKLTSAQRHTLYRLLVENEKLFKDMGLDAMAPPKKFSEADSARIRKSLEGRIPPDIMYKLENLTLDKWQMADMETLAGIMGDIRREGRERLKANRDARNKINRDYQTRFEKIVEKLLGPKDVERLPGAETDETEDKRAKWRNLTYSLINARRYFRMLEGGVDGVMHDVVMGGVNRAFDEQTRHELARRKAVQDRLDKAGIKLRELWSNTFTLADGRTVSLDDMLFYHRAALNDRAYAAVVFGNFAFPSERKAMEAANNAGKPDEVLRLEGEVVKRYDAAMKQLDEFLAQPENQKFRDVEAMIGEDYDNNYDRLKEFAAREFNLDLGSEAYYIPLGRKNAAADEHETIQEIFASAGVAHSLEKGFFKERQDIDPWHQSEVKTGLYKTWDQMITKQEHLMAYAGYLRNMKQIFQGRGSETLMNIIKRKFSKAGTEYIEHFIAEIASPQTQRDYTNLDTMTRLMRGHYPAAVLVFRLSSVIKQAVTSPPPFLQFMSVGEYAAAGAACLSEETRNMIRELSPYMASRVFDPADEFIRQMEMTTLMGKGGKAEALLAKAERIGMKPLEWIDSVCVMPGWLGAYRKKLAELDRAGGMDAALMTAEAVRFADQVVQDTQPSSRQIDLPPLFKHRKNPFMQMFLQFQVPQSVIMQNLFVDAPNNFKQGRFGAAVTTFAIYALTAAAVGLMGEDDDEEKLDLKRRGIDAFAGYLESIPIAGGYAAYQVEGFLKDGKFRPSQIKPFPVLDEAFKAGNAVTQQQWDQAFIRSLKTFGYYSGLPVGLAGEIEKAVAEGDPMVLLGWK